MAQEEKPEGWEKYDQFIQEEIDEFGVDHVISLLAFYLESLSDTYDDKDRVKELVQRGKDRYHGHE